MKKILKTSIVAAICLMTQTAVSAEENTDSKNNNKNLYFNRGYRANIELDWSNGGKGFGGYLRPSVGVDIWRFSLTLSYELMGNPHRKSYTDLSGATATESWRSNANNFNVDIAFRF